MIIGDFFTTLSVTDRTINKNISKDMENLNYTSNHLNLDVYIPQYVTTIENKFLSHVHWSMHENKSYAGP